MLLTWLLLWPGRLRIRLRASLTVWLRFCACAGCAFVLFATTLPATECLSGLSGSVFLLWGGLGRFCLRLDLLFAHACVSCFLSSATLCDSPRRNVACALATNAGLVGFCAVWFENWL
jgi:hypothetical protein